MKLRLLAFFAIVGIIFACSGTAQATTWGPNPNSFNYSAADTVQEGGNSYSWRGVTGTTKQIQYGISAPHDDSFESDDSSNNPVPLSIGFNFRFFGQIYDGVYVSSNGAICLVNDDNKSKYSNAIANNSWNWDAHSGFYSCLR
ncbi:MAG: hypothetical protein U5N86_01165 [Planctomycetota bacterium]|nr:hypothetical protein [Planctomycetota bacterium]